MALTSTGIRKVRPAGTLRRPFPSPGLDKAIIQ